MLKLTEIFIVIKNATSPDKVYLDEDGEWTSNIKAAKEFNSGLDAHMGLKRVIDNDDDAELNVYYKVESFMKTTYVR